MKTVITYGTFDLFHVGHLNLLRRAKELGDYLIVAVSSDEFNLGKNKVCKIKDTDRMKIVEAIKYVDKVIPETSWEQKIEDVKKYNVDVFVMGDDWKGKFDFLTQKRCSTAASWARVAAAFGARALPPTPKISSCATAHCIGLTAYALMPP